MHLVRQFEIHFVAAVNFRRYGRKLNSKHNCPRNFSVVEKQSSVGKARDFPFLFLGWKREKDDFPNANDSRQRSEASMFVNGMQNRSRERRCLSRKMDSAILRNGRRPEPEQHLIAFDCRPFVIYDSLRPRFRLLSRPFFLIFLSAFCAPSTTLELGHKHVRLANLCETGGES